VPAGVRPACGFTTGEITTEHAGARLVAEIGGDILAVDEQA